MSARSRISGAGPAWIGRRPSPRRPSPRVHPRPGEIGRIIRAEVPEGRERAAQRPVRLSVEATAVNEDTGPGLDRPARPCRHAHDDHPSPREVPTMRRAPKLAKWVYDTGQELSRGGTDEYDLE
ncbi:hypothetical protein GCM10023195_83460 [Actinoallomurus liliacearum]|uniref:Uncharacterized protein n=1 Tax=Actinoallomurus liliacearum TaxID=1080073 RepID=A0ABP8TX10_9ACTN